MGLGEADTSQSATMQNIATLFLKEVLKAKIQVLANVRQVSLKTQSRARFEDPWTSHGGGSGNGGLQRTDTHVHRSTGCHSITPKPDWCG